MITDATQIQADKSHDDSAEANLLVHPQTRALEILQFGKSHRQRRSDFNDHPSEDERWDAFLKQMTVDRNRTWDMALSIVTEYHSELKGNPHRT